MKKIRIFRRYEELMAVGAATSQKESMTEVNTQATGADDTVAAPCPIRPGQTGEAQGGKCG